jgi:hypothetical protein
MKKIYILLFVLGLVGLSAFATGKQIVQGGEASVEDVDLTKLPVLEGEHVKLYHSEGAEELAALQLKRTEGIVSYYSQMYDVDPQIEVRILDREDWTGPIPYGMPSVRPGVPLMITGPATGDGVIARDALQYADIVPASISEPLARIGLSYEDAARQYPDLIVYHETGHAFQFALGMKEVPMWFAEFTASYFLWNYLVHEDPDMAVLFKTMSHATYMDGSTPDHVTMHDLNTLYADGVGMQNYDWYQKQLNLKIISVYQKYDMDFMDRAVERFANRPDISSDQLVAELEEMFPGEFADWSQNMGKL